MAKTVEDLKNMESSGNFTLPDLQAPC